LPVAIKAELLQDITYKLAKQRFLNDANWVWQEKWNGDRRLITKNGDEICDYNRNGEKGKGLSPEVIAALRAHPLDKFIIDTEFVSAFNVLIVFDVLQFGENIIVGEQYRTRLQVLNTMFTKGTFVQPIETAFTAEEKTALVKRLLAECAEGFCIKDLNAPYRPADNNVRYNYRMKFWKTLDAVVIGDSTKVVDGKLRDSVRLGLYLPDGTLKDICGATKKSRYNLKPGDVVEVKYLYGTGTLDIVQIDILHLRDDKAASLCTVDQIIVNKNWRKKAA
jgi:ATP-dependent DNA ligase